MRGAFPVKTNISRGLLGAYINRGLLIKTQVTQDLPSLYKSTAKSGPSRGLPCKNTSNSRPSPLENADKVDLLRGLLLSRWRFPYDPIDCLLKDEVQLSPRKHRQLTTFHDLTDPFPMKTTSILLRSGPCGFQTQTLHPKTIAAYDVPSPPVTNQNKNTKRTSIVRHSRPETISCCDS